MTAPCLLRGVPRGALRRLLRRGLPLAVCASAAAQLPSRPAAAQTVSVSGRLQSYGFGEPAATGLERLQLRSGHVRAAAPLGPRLTLDVTAAWAEGIATDRAGAETSISGLTDTQVVLGFAAPGGVRLAAIGLLPTGLAEQTLEQSRVAGAVAADLLPFAVSNWGSGGGAGGMASIARTAGALGLGVSVSYIARRSYEPLAATAFGYRPGDVLSIVGALDGNPTPVTKASLRVAWHRYTDDEVGDVNLFRSGDRIEATGSLAFPVARGASGIAYASLHHRGEGSFLEIPQALPSRDLVLLGGGLRVPLGGAVLQPDVHARLFRRSDGLEQGWDLGVGSDVEIPAGNVRLVPGLRVHVGRVEVREGVDTGLTGFEVSLAARFGGGS